jgi:hypothetical protein
VDSSEGDEAHEVDEEFVISCCDAPELLDLIEEAFDAIAFFVDSAIIFVLVAALRHGRNDGDRVFVENGIMQAVGIIGAISQHIVGLKTVDQRFGLADIAVLPRCADQAQAIAQSLDGGMDFSGQPTFGAAQALGVRPPFFLRAPAAWLCARMTMLSMHSHSKSASWFNASRIAPKTPRPIQS